MGVLDNQEDQEDDSEGRVVGEYAGDDVEPLADEPMEECVDGEDMEEEPAEEDPLAAEDEDGNDNASDQASDADDTVSLPETPERPINPALDEWFESPRAGHLKPQHEVVNMVLALMDFFKDRDPQVLKRPVCISAFVLYRRARRLGFRYAWVGLETFRHSMLQVQKLSRVLCPLRVGL